MIIRTKNVQQNKSEKVHRDHNYVTTESPRGHKHQQLHTQLKQDTDKNCRDKVFIVLTKKSHPSHK